ncbi:hypothetical protein KUTeg_018875 [Tegillarca granosa]|uniref:Uncharacterized protein n=1 Tax=Tegillarca granosa TaxID=220873 RepID=A0ABQ9EAW1_TEGGR|nr:hypothetical protein KUTeg_018875 [Tegillarca granosa]
MYSRHTCMSCVKQKIFMGHSIKFMILVSVSKYYILFHNINCVFVKESNKYHFSSVSVAQMSALIFKRMLLDLNKNT